MITGVSLVLSAVLASIIETQVVSSEPVTKAQRVRELPITVPAAVSISCMPCSSMLVMLAGLIALESNWKRNRR